MEELRDNIATFMAKIKFEFIMAIWSSIVVSLLVGVKPLISQEYTSLYFIGTTTLYIFVMAIILYFKAKLTTKNDHIHEMDDKIGKMEAMIYRLEEANKEKEDEILEIEAQKSFERRNEAAILATETIKKATKTTRMVSEVLQKVAIIHREKSIDGNSVSEFLYIAKKDIIERVLRDLVAVFMADSRGKDNTRYPYNHFKAALFEVGLKKSQEILKRIAYEYPEGKDPYAETAEIVVSNGPHCAHVISYKEDKLVLIEDIQEEAKKPPSEARWMDLRERQSNEYASMLCVPIVRGKRDTKYRKVLAVLVIDTNREKYFKEDDESYKTFLKVLLTPFRTLLSISYDLNELGRIDEIGRPRN